jgi:hypothetical protein
MNLTELTAAVVQFTENDEASFVANIPLFIRQAEQRIYNTVQFPSLRKNVTGQTSANVKYLQCPSDFLASYSMAVITGTAPNETYEFLLNKDVNFIRQAYTNPAATGVPRYYALFGPNSSSEDSLVFLLGPTPAAAYSIELHYFYYPESITVAADGTTWLSNNFDSVLLYGTLAEAYTYMKGDPDILSYYMTRYEDALAMAKRLGDGMERQDAYRSGQVRLPVT